MPITQVIPKRLLKEARDRGIVVMVGAGASAIPPSALPGWYSFNEMVVDVLARHFESYVESPGFVDEVGKAIHERRNANRFPPDYQAQIIEEACGDRYFQALQSLDIDSTNKVHHSIARLARQGVLKAIVTTNFDRLLERALTVSGVAFESAYEPIGYKRIKERLAGPTVTGPLPLVKIHGSVEDLSSMVDTLKQRRLGRNDDLTKCLAALLQSHYWLYMGFSAGDLETDDDYLGIVSSVDRSPGLVYLQWPGAKGLGDGARKMISAYGRKATVVVEELETFVPALADALESPQVASPSEVSTDATQRVSDALEKWASHLDPADTAVCLAAMAEAAGESAAAFSILHRFWNWVRPQDRETEAFERFRLLHGRLGMGTGLLSYVDDISTNRGMESFQDLFRVAGRDPRGWVWGGISLIWGGQVKSGLSNMSQAGVAWDDGEMPDEWKVDIWLGLAEARYLTALMDEDFIESWGTVNECAKVAGDLARQGRVAAMHSLLIAEFALELFDAFTAEYAAPILEQAERLRDPSIFGFQALARGRAATRRRDTETAQNALALAIENLNRAGRYPWSVYCEIEFAKALMDGGHLHEACDQLDHINTQIDRYQVLLPWYEEARGQYHRMIGQEDIASSAFEKAVGYAQQFGLDHRVDYYRQYQPGGSLGPA